MATRRVTAKQWPGVLKRRLMADTRLLKRAALGAVKRGEAEAVALTKSGELVDRGTFLRGWTSGSTDDGAYLRNDTPYASVIEYGRRPGAPGPPLQPILEWVYRKLVGNGSVEEADAEEVARAIQISIHRKGTPPVFILRDVSSRMKGYLRDEALRLLKRGK